MRPRRRHVAAPQHQRREPQHAQEDRLRRSAVELDGCQGGNVRSYQRRGVRSGHRRARRDGLPDGKRPDDHRGDPRGARGHHGRQRGGIRDHVRGARASPGLGEPRQRRRDEAPHRRRRRRPAHRPRTARAAVQVGPRDALRRRGAVEPVLRRRHQGGDQDVPRRAGRFRGGEQGWIGDDEGQGEGRALDVERRRRDGGGPQDQRGQG